MIELCSLELKEGGWGDEWMEWDELSFCLLLCVCQSLDWLDLNYLTRLFGSVKIFWTEVLEVCRRWSWLLLEKERRVVLATSLARSRQRPTSTPRHTPSLNPSFSIIDELQSSNFHPKSALSPYLSLALPWHSSASFDSHFPVQYDGRNSIFSPSSLTNIKTETSPREWEGRELFSKFQDQDACVHNGPKTSREVTAFRRENGHEDCGSFTSKQRGRRDHILVSYSWHRRQIIEDLFYCDQRFNDSPKTHLA